MNKYEIKIDDTTFIVDKISYEYSQLDGDEAGRSDDGTMYRDVIGLTNKVYCNFNDKNKLKGATLSTLLKMVEKKSCSFNFFDVKENKRITKSAYIVSDKIDVNLINDEFVAEPFQIRFIQMNVDNI